MPACQSPENPSAAVLQISASRSYTVSIGSPLADIGALAAGLQGASCAAVISDTAVFPLYGNTVCDSLRAAGFHTVSHILPAGEDCKQLTYYTRLLHFLCENRLGRNDFVVALGGGALGDAAAFAAATYLRGIRCIQLPTTLLAMVDASVGGKCAINLDGFKNQVGAFAQPAAVLCDTAVLASLPREQYRSGCGEIIKYALLEGGSLIHMLKTPVCSQYESIIACCVDIKRRYVAADEFDRGRRRLLNFGHSVGHALEAPECGSLSHGTAVAVGMAVITRAAVKRGLCSPDTLHTLQKLLADYGLPDNSPQSAYSIADAMLHDKKIRGDSIELVIPRSVGNFSIESVPLRALPDWLHDGGII